MSNGFSHEVLSELTCLGREIIDEAKIPRLLLIFSYRYRTWLWTVLFRRIDLNLTASGEDEDRFRSRNPVPPSLAPWPLVIVMITGLVVVLPLLHFGIPSGHDFEFHMNSWIEVVAQWKQGILHPQWAALAHYGYGEARFSFYPPASWTLGAALGLLFPWKMVPAAYIWIALTLSGCSMFLLARRWLSRQDATFAAALFAVNPYHLVIVYWRSAFAELLAASLLPLLVLLVLRIEESPGKKRLRATILLALVVAGAWLTNIPSAVMVTYSLGFFAVVLAVTRRSWPILIYAAGAAVLAVGLAAFYLVPVAAEQKWINISQVLAPGVRPEDNFLFTTLEDPDHNVFNRLISLVAVAEIAAFAAAALFFFPVRKRASVEWWYVFGWGAAAALPMLSVTLPAWRYLPELRFVQLPWRWLLCLNVALTLSAAATWRRWFTRGLVVVALGSIIVMVWHRVLPPWWDSSGDIAEMLDDQESGKGYEGVDEYVPAGADGYEIKKDAPLVKFVSKGKSTDKLAADDRRVTNSINENVSQWTAVSKSFTAKVSRPGTLALRLFNYPAWKVEVNDRTVAIASQAVTGQMEIPVTPGTNRVNITLISTSAQAIGAEVSLVTLFLLTVLVALHRYLNHEPSRVVAVL